jgi:hypothetical protein
LLSFYIKEELCKEKLVKSLILILIITMVVTFSCNLVTFAIFNEEISKKDNLAFGKVELSSNTNVVLDSTTNIVGGEVISNAGFSFSKSSSSAPILLEQKLHIILLATNVQAVNYTYMLRQYGLDVSERSKCFKYLLLEKNRYLLLSYEWRATL